MIIDKIAHFPAGKKNPYNTLLGQALQDAEVTVDLIPNRFAKNPWQVLSFARDYKLVHWHWFDGHYEGKTLLVFIARSALFLSALAYLRIVGVKMVHTVHNLIPHEHKYRALHGLVNRGIGMLMHKLLVHNKASVEVVSKEYGNKHKIQVVEHIDYAPELHSKVHSTSVSDPYKHSTANGKQPTAIFFGQLRPYKGLETLIQAATLCELNIVIAGKPYNQAYADELLERTRDLPNLKLLPKFIEDAELSDLLAASDIAVFPYSESLTSGAAHYVLAHDLPIVAPATTAFTEFIALGIATEWTAPHTPQSLAEALVVASKPDWSSWQLANKDYRERCSSSNIGQKLKQVYMELITDQ